jgi:hypothetical protein
VVTAMVTAVFPKSRVVLLSILSESERCMFAECGGHTCNPGTPEVDVGGS